MADDVAITAGAGTTIATRDIGGRHHQLVMPSVSIVRVAVTPTISTSPAYSVADQVGGKMTFTGAAFASGRGGTITSAKITARWANTVIPILELFLYEADPTVTSVDNGAANIADADREAGLELPGIKFVAANWMGMSGNTSCDGTFVGGQPAIDFLCSGSANLFGILVTRTIFTAASTTDLVVALRIRQN